MAGEGLGDSLGSLHRIFPAVFLGAVCAGIVGCSLGAMSRPVLEKICCFSVALSQLRTVKGRHQAKESRPDR